MNLGEPYDPCKKEAVPSATCLQECKKKAAEVKCGCSDTMDTFPDNNAMTTCDVMGTLCILKMRGIYIDLVNFRVPLSGMSENRQMSYPQL